jgi:hypothetical protein
MVSGDYFSVLGARPALGTFFTSEVDQPREAHPVAVISYADWRTRLGWRARPASTLGGAGDPGYGTPALEGQL